LSYAVSTVMRMYQDAGYEVEDVGAYCPWDITAIRDDEEIHIEVKGSTTKRDEIDITDGEVRHALNHQPTYLIVIDAIIVQEGPDGFECSGGRRRQWKN
jgi:hypothetical protein